MTTARRPPEFAGVISTDPSTPLTSSPYNNARDIGFHSIMQKLTVIVASVVTVRTTLAFCQAMMFSVERSRASTTPSSERYPTSRQSSESSGVLASVGASVPTGANDTAPVIATRTRPESAMRVLSFLSAQGAAAHCEFGYEVPNGLLAGLQQPRRSGNLGVPAHRAATRGCAQQRTDHGGQVRRVLVVACEHADTKTRNLVGDTLPCAAIAPDDDHPLLTRVRNLV